MSMFPQGPFAGMNARGQTLNYRSQAEEVSVGQFFNAVYAWMAVGLAVTAAVSFMVAQSGYIMANPAVWIIALIAQIGLVSVIGGATNRISAGVATVLFLIYAALNG